MGHLSAAGVTAHSGDLVHGDLGIRGIVRAFASIEGRNAIIGSNTGAENDPFPLLYKNLGLAPIMVDRKAVFPTPATWRTPNGGTYRFPDAFDTSDKAGGRGDLFGQLAGIRLRGGNSFGVLADAFSLPFKGLHSIVDVGAWPFICTSRPPFSEASSVNRIPLFLNRGNAESARILEELVLGYIAAVKPGFPVLMFSMDGEKAKLQDILDKLKREKKLRLSTSLLRKTSFQCIPTSCVGKNSGRRGISSSFSRNKSANRSSEGLIFLRVQDIFPLRGGLG